jgi:hypothetical protein
MNYIAKPRKVNAVKWTGDNIADVFAICNRAYRLSPTELFINTDNGKLIVHVGNWIVKERNEYFVVKDEMFTAQYDKDKQIYDIDLCSINGETTNVTID